ncbi:GAF and ANTAR domain-containing protein [Streptomyces sp. NPDC087300]|uniref:GAF and ANTAR domain-containing protein n=1 Tax=Streptomyces sp. NPDC087300 TaxID=3365780 RepID=UPI0038190001
MNREQQLAEAFVGLTDTLADDFDPVVLLDRLAGHVVDIVGADDVGIMMATARGGLRTMSASDGGAALVELLQLRTGEGPCLDCFRTGRSVDAVRLADAAAVERWPRLAPLAAQAGYLAVHALPLRVNHQVIGALTVLVADPDGLSDDELRLAQALADVAAVALIHYRPDPARPSDVLTRVQAAVSARATVDMATGMLAEGGLLELADAGRVLRIYARRHGGRLTEVAQALVRRELELGTVLADATGATG